MKDIKKQSLIKSFAILLGVQMLFVFCIQNIVTVRMVKKYMKNDFDTYSEIIVKDDIEKIRQWNSAIFNALEYYISMSRVNGTPEATVRWFEKDTASFSNVTEILFIANDGTGYTHDGSTFDASKYCYFSPLIYQKKQNYISNFQHFNGYDCYFVGRPVKLANQSVIGAFVAVIKTDTIDNLTKTLKVGENGYGIIVGSDSIAITHMGASKDRIDFSTYSRSGYKGFDKIAEDIFNRTPGNKSYTYNEENYAIYAPIQNCPWTLLLSVPAPQVELPGDKLKVSLIEMSTAFGIFLLISAIFILTTVIKPLTTVGSSLKKIASGDADLTNRIEVKRNDEVGEVGHQFNSFMEKLHDIVSRIKASKDTLSNVNATLQDGISNNVSSINGIISSLESVSVKGDNQGLTVQKAVASLEQVTETIENLDSLIEAQSSAVTEASAAVEEMIGNITAVNTSVTHMAVSFDGLTSNTETGIQKQNTVNTIITKIEEQSKSLQDANKVISTIASQTNLLAMNAAIEAAHAGESGKGFSVVADEIRKLSENSSSQSKKIQNELKNIQSSIGSAVDASVSSSQSFAEVSSNIEQTQQLVMQIKAAMEEQQIGSKQIVDALKVMNDNTHEVHIASKNMNEISAQISSQVKDVQDSTLDIQGSMKNVGMSIGNVKQSTAELESISTDVKDIVSQIGDQIDLFTV